MDKCKEILEQLNREIRRIRKADLKAGKEKTVMIPMRDGVKLFTRFIFPEGVTKGIVTFQRSCYAFQTPIFEWMAYQMACRGYISGYQLCRGIGQSQGQWEPFVNEKNDGLDTLYWLEQQDFAEQIGLYGLSYGGYTQWFVADGLTPKVKTMVIIQAGTDRYRSAYTNGCFRHDVYTGWAVENAKTEKKEIYPDCCLYRPFLKMDEAVMGKRLSWFRDWLLHVDEKDTYWTEGIWGDLKKTAEKISVPVFLTGGWYDHHLEGMFYAWNHLKESVREKSVFLIGPWIHGMENGVDAYDIDDHTHDSPFGFNEAFRFLDSFFCKREDLKPGITGYMIGKDKWMHKDTLQEGNIRTFGLFCNGSNKFIHNPDNPVKAKGAESMLYAPPTDRGSKRQEIKEDNRIIYLHTKELEEPLTICGSVKVSLEIESEASDTMIIVKLLEEFQNGEVYNIRTGASTIGYRNQAKERVDDYIPGMPVRMEFQLWPIMWALQKGSKIRVSVSSSNFPEFHVHTNMQGSWSMQDKIKTVVNKVNVENSFLELPLSDRKNEE